MTTMASQITSFTVVYSIVYSGVDQRKHQSSASLAFVRGIHRDRWIPRTNDQLRGKCFHLMTSSCEVWNEVTYPFPNFNGTVEVWEWISNFIPHIIMIIGMLIRINKRDSWTAGSLIPTVTEITRIVHWYGVKFIHLHWNGHVILTKLSSLVTPKISNFGWEICKWW